MKKLLFGLGLLMPFLLSAQQVARSLTAANGTFIGFLEYKPPMYGTNTTAKFPLIIFLHGIGEKGDGSPASLNSSVANVGIPRNITYGLTNMQFNYNGSTQAFLVLSPQLNVNGVNPYNWSPYYVEEMIKYAKENLRVDPDRIYLTGMSLGGGGVWNYSSSSAAAAKGLAAIAPVCGTINWTNSGMGNIAQQALPVWAFHAMDDGVVSPAETQTSIYVINSYNPIVPPLTTYYPTGNHWIWDQVYDPANPQLYLWMLSKSRSGSAPPPPPPPTGGNAAPVAVTSGNLAITLPTNSVFLLGSGSYDQGGYITNYSWTQQSGPNTASLTAMNANLDVKNMVAGTYVFKLTVTDNGGATNAATATITVSGTTPPPPPPAGGGAGAPLAVASAHQTISLPTNSIFLLGSGSYDVGGYITNYAWSQQSGPNTAGITPMGSNLDVKNMIGGTYVFKLTVTDNSGLTGSTTTTITVNGGSAPPPTGGAGAPIAVASANQTITSSSVFLLGSGSYDAGGWITNYAWSQQSGPNTATITPMGANLDVKNMVSGTYVFKLTVTDNSGLTGSTTTTVTVNGGTPPPTGGAGAPTAVAGSNQYITLPTSSVFLMGGGSYDVGGWVTKFAWSQDAGPSTATLSPVNPSNVEARNLVAGTYTFRLTVTDNSGLTSSSTMQVIVKW